MAPAKFSERKRVALRVVGAVAVGALGGLFAVWRVSSDPQSTVAAAAVIRPQGRASWSDHREGDRETVTLERGTLWIHVDHAASRRGLLVVLPDGELEDVGTTFTVTSADDHAARVSVEEGRVVLRLGGRPPRTLAPGETWVAESPPPVVEERSH